jgi:hypothetical protein
MNGYKNMNNASLLQDDMKIEKISCQLHKQSN